MSLAFLNLTCNFISDTYCNLEVLGFPLKITWQLVTNLVYQVFAGDLDDARGFMRIVHGTRDHLMLASRTIWAVFKTNKVMKAIQLQGLSHHPLVVGTYISFLITNSEIVKSDKLSKEIKNLQDTIKNLTAEVKAAKGQASAAITKADKALAKK
eukprot:8850887-Ditylum_brightwellii.AAC.1